MNFCYCVIISKALFCDETRHTRKQLMVMFIFNAIPTAIFLVLLKKHQTGLTAESIKVDVTNELCHSHLRIGIERP